MAEAETTLEKRVSAVEQEVEGEKLVTRHILEQTRRNSDDLVAIRSQLTRMEHRQDRVDADIRAVRSDVTALRTEFTGLVSNLPAMIAETMREVLRERDR
jgi:hypothetical protein